MTEIRVPKLNANDVTYTLVEWLVEAGAPVHAGDPVATVETSKAAEELASAVEGVLHHALPVGTQCAVGEVIGHVLPQASAEVPQPVAHDGAGPLITEPARRAMAARGIDLASVRALNRKVIRVADLADLGPPAPADAGGVLVSLSAGQRAVGVVVTESHRTVPAAFVAVRVPLDAALLRGRALTREHRRLVGLPELLIAAVGTLARRYPRCFGSLIEPGVVRLAGTVDVGVTVDVGNGLYVPVVRDVAALSVREIAERLMAFRLTAMRGTFQAADVVGANILVALHTDDDVTVAVPVVLPGTVCALSLAGRQSELELDAAGALVRRTVTQLGLAYDHRVINGRDAVEFLRAISDALQDR